MDNALTLLLAAGVMLGLAGWVTRTRPASDGLSYEVARLQFDINNDLREDLKARDRLIVKLRADVRRLNIYIDLLRDGWRTCNPNAQIPPRPTLEANGDGDTPTNFDLGELQRKLGGRLDLGEWRDAAIQIDSRFDGAGYTTVAEFSEQFLRYLSRHGRLPRLLKWLADTRPDIQLGDSHGWHSG